MRYGTRTNLKRRWTPKGFRPKCPMKIGYEFGYLYTAIYPKTGDLFCMMLPNMTKDCFEIFTNEFKKTLDKSTLFILDGARNHSQSFNDELLTIAKLPAASPELNPVENFFKQIRKQLANKVFENIQEVEKVLTDILHTFFIRPDIVSKVTFYPYLHNTT
ncbi:hypothetical protein EON78_06180 [bacterium]|nr:MAG: hypothetical protein EON78_06180 [bacterium]